MRLTQSRSGFSLVELLVTVAVLLALAGMLIPAVRGFGQSSGLTIGGNLVTNLATLARQEAMTRNTLTALLMLKDQGTESDYRAFCVLAYNPQSIWIPLTSWEILPTGVIVDPDTTTHTSNAESISFIKYSPAELPFVGGNATITFQGTPLRSYASRVFLPNGSLMNAQDPAHLRLVEGFRSGNQIVRTRRGKANSPASYYDIALIGATGIAIVDRP